VADSYHHTTALLHINSINQHGLCYIVTADQMFAVLPAAAAAAAAGDRLSLKG